MAVCNREAVNVFVSSIGRKLIASFYDVKRYLWRANVYQKGSTGQNSHLIHEQLLCVLLSLSLSLSRAFQLTIVIWKNRLVLAVVPFRVC